MKNKLFETANKYIPGGVNSPVRAFKSVGLEPIFMKKGDGTYLYDVDNNKYIDYVCSWGPLILGHNNEKIKNAILDNIQNGLSFGTATKIEVEMAKFICDNVPCVDKIRMVNSGTEAVMSAIRLARGYTGKNKIIKFDGCYHGHSDSLLIQAGSGLMSSPVPNSIGVPKGCTDDTISIKYNDLDILEQALIKHKNEVACVIIEPVSANMGVVLPKNNYLKSVRNLCTKYNALLVFDEVITGFRLGFTGASGYFDVVPDLVTYGKVIGAGMPVGAYGGKREIMDMVSPSGNVYQAGTLSGNPIAMSAGLTQLKILQENPDIYHTINKLSSKFFENVNSLLGEYNIDATINYIGSIGSIFFTKDMVTDYNTAKKSNTKMYADYFTYMINNGIYLAPSQFEAMFFSYAHTDETIDYTLDVIKKYILTIR